MEFDEIKEKYPLSDEERENRIACCKYCIRTDKNPTYADCQVCEYDEKTKTKKVFDKIMGMALTINFKSFNKEDSEIIWFALGSHLQKHESEITKETIDRIREMRKEIKKFLEE